MDNFHFVNSTEMFFGKNSINHLTEYIKGKYKKVLFVCGAGPFRENGTYDKIVSIIEKSDAEVIQMSDIPQNPKVKFLREGTDICIKENVDFIVALGGGSAIDGAKLIAAASYMKVDPFDLIWGKRILVEGALPMAAIPTISATGTEINNFAVAVNEEAKEKYWCQTEFPKYAFLDPCITATVPLRLAIWGAMDILSHNFEFYLNGYMKSEFQLRLSESLILSTISAVDQMCADPSDVDARGELMWCAAVSWGSGLTKIGRGPGDMACHSMEESFSGFFDNHHGACLGVITPRWMKYVYKKHIDVFARFARNIMHIQEENDEKAAELGVDAYIKWLHKINAPQTYADIGLKIEQPQELDVVANNAWKIYDQKIGVLEPLTLNGLKDILYAGMNPLI